VLIRPDGKIASLLSYGDDAIRKLVTRGASMKPDGPRKRELEVMGNGHKPEITIGTPHAYDDVGKPAPSFSLQSSDGDVVQSDQLLGRDTLLLFWDPKCPFCKSISDALKKWEVNPPANAPRLVLVSSAEGEDASAESKEFKSLYLCDPSLEVGMMFGTNLTPSAVLIDSNGRIASAPTAGPENIMALAGVSKTSMRWIPNP
jgi:peroxiredoxin